MKGYCPHCSHEMECPPETPGLNCSACNQRVIVRNGAFLTIEQAKPQGNPSTAPTEPSVATSSIDNQITPETFNPRLHVAEYKRTCNSCGKVWHSLTKREEELSKKSEDLCGMCATCGNHDAFVQKERNMDASKSSLTQLKQCPECKSTNYTETTLYYEKPH